MSLTITSKIVEIIKYPLEFALKGKKFAKISTEEVEEISLKEQKKHESFAWHFVIPSYFGNRS